MKRRRCTQHMELGSSPDPRRQSVRLQAHLGKLRIKEMLGIIAEENMQTQDEDSVQPNKDGSIEELMDRRKKKNSGKNSGCKKCDEELDNVTPAGNDTTSDPRASDKASVCHKPDNIIEMNPDEESSCSSPELVHEDDIVSISSSLDHESYEDVDFTAPENEGSSSSQQVCEDDIVALSGESYEDEPENEGSSSTQQGCEDDIVALSGESYDDEPENEGSSSTQQGCEEDTQIQSGKTAFGQKIRGNRNSTLLETSKAQAIDKMHGPGNISNIKDTPIQSGKTAFGQKIRGNRNSTLLETSKAQAIDKMHGPDNILNIKDTQIQSGKTAFGQEIRGKRNSTLLETSKAQAIYKMHGPDNISNIKDTQIQSRKTAFGQEIRGKRNSTLLETSKAQAIDKIHGPDNISNIKDTQIQSGKTAFGHEIRGNRNSTLLETSKAQAIDKMHGPDNISNISPIEEDRAIHSDKRLPQKEKFDLLPALVPGDLRKVTVPKESKSTSSSSEQAQKTGPSTVVSGKPLHKVKKEDLNGRDDKSSTKVPKIEYLVSDEHNVIPDARKKLGLCPWRKPFSYFAVQKYLMPKQRLRQPCLPKPAKRVRFTDPLTTGISIIDMEN